MCNKNNSIISHKDGQSVASFPHKVNATLPEESVVSAVKVCRLYKLKYNVRILKIIQGL